MKTILVPVGGSGTDDAVFETALAAAHALSAHLQFIHVHIDVAEAAQHTPHMKFARSAAIRNSLRELRQQVECRAATAARNVEEFCSRRKIAMSDSPPSSPRVTASWRQEEGDALARLIVHGRHSDLVVLGRPGAPDGLPNSRLEDLLIQSGRPLLIAAPMAPQRLLGTVMVGWKESPDAARALSAAMPLLAKAQHVVILTVTEGPDKAAGEGLGEIARHLRWHGISCDPRIVRRGRTSPAELIAATARDCGAGMLVVGASGHRPAKERLFGGCTCAMIEAAELPVFMFH
jgi:nucleotide-binding universal stress UspA family protein